MASDNKCIKVDDSLSVRCITIKSDSYDPCIQVTADVAYINITPDTEPPLPPVLNPSERPELSILTINGDVPEEGVNYDPVEDIYYVKDFDIVIVEITNYIANATYICLGADTDPTRLWLPDGVVDNPNISDIIDCSGGNNGVVVDNEDGTLTWYVQNNLDGWDKECFIYVIEAGKSVSEKGFVEVVTMKQSGQPILDGLATIYAGEVSQVIISNHEESNTYEITDFGVFVSADILPNTDIVEVISPNMNIGDFLKSYVEMTSTEPYHYTSSKALIYLNIIYKTCQLFKPTTYSLVGGDISLDVAFVGGWRTNTVLEVTYYTADGYLRIQVSNGIDFTVYAEIGTQSHSSVAYVRIGYIHYAVGCDAYHYQNWVRKEYIDTFWYQYYHISLTINVNGAYSFIGS